MIITIDGPAGAGKSAIARRLAASLGYEYLDTGAMYRTIALLGQRSGVDWDVPSALVALAKSARIDMCGGRPCLDGEDVGDAVRSAEITRLTRFSANNPGVREVLVDAQRRIGAEMEAAGKGLVTEGRDQGTVVFPNAGCKIFLTATPVERARRRLGEMRLRGEHGDFDEILREINVRDEGDRAREVGPLCQPADAVLVLTDGLDIPAVLERLVAIVAERLRVGVP